MANLDHFDDFPRPRRSPRLYGGADSISGSAPSRVVSATRLNDEKLRRLRDMAIVTACRMASPPVPYATIICRLGISERHARNLYKLGLRMKLQEAARPKFGR